MVLCPVANGRWAGSLREAVGGQSPSCIGHRSSCAVRVGTGEAGASPAWERRGGVGSPQRSGGEPLAGGAGGLREQAEEDGPSVGKGRKLAHVADAPGEDDDGGPATEQGL